MATRQRAPRSSNKAPAIPAQSTTASETSISTGLPEEPSAADSGSDVQIRFVGEQLRYRSREERIAESAYLYAEARGFEPGYELEDWLKAEREVDALLSSSGDYQAS
jgi:hypothetical protein